MWKLQVLALGACLLSTSAAIADDWTAVRLRGQMLELVGEQWQTVSRGAVVADGTIVRSLGDGYADFVRGTETVSIGPNSQIEIADQAAAGTKPFTTVTEYFGTVEIDADVEKVQHFAVNTPYLAAVVKGTHFVVTSGAGGASVTVDRGHVAVSDFADHTQVTVTVGQTATVSAQHPADIPGMVVSGAGVLPPVLKDKPDKGPKAGKGGPDPGRGGPDGGPAKDKSDNGKGNGGVPGNGKGKQAALTLPFDWLSAIA